MTAPSRTCIREKYVHAPGRLRKIYHKDFLCACVAIQYLKIVYRCIIYSATRVQFTEDSVVID